ncbi:MAG: FG-GAP-like repeat-containing protein [Planctomycetaceae bacterium]
MRRKFLMIAALGFLIGIPGLFFAIPGSEIPAKDLLKQARTALLEKHFSDAERLVKSIPPTDPHFVEAMLIAGESATRLNRFEDAVQYYRLVPLDGSEKSVLAQFSLANVLIHTGDLSAAFAAFVVVLESEPMDVATHSRVAFLYAASARRWESRPHLELILRSGGATVEELALLADLERPVDEEAYLKKCEQSYPNDPNVRLGLASIAAQNGQPAAAILELQKIIHEQPELMAAQALVGELLASERSSRFDTWHAELPSNADQWPDIWYARGVRAQLLEHQKIAARCFWQVLRISPIHRRANYQLGRILAELHDANANGFAEQSRQLFSLTQALMHALRSEGRNEVIMQQIVQTLDRMGRVWETCAWAQLSRKNFPQSEWPTAFLQRLAPLLNDQLPMVLADRNLAIKCDLSSFPEYTDILSAQIPEQRTAPDSAVNTTIQFLAESAIGIDFVYQNAADDSTRGSRMQEQTGGAVTVVDVDQDGWQDLYFVQGAQWSTGNNVPNLTNGLIDRIYRNRIGRKFQDMTALTDIDERGFGQSCAAGDFNNDGFDDLYVANIGQNSLLLSNGDGTFTQAEIPVESPVHWTSSCAIADINSDGLPDLVDINYVSGSDVFTRICSGRACSPSAFNGTLDQVHFSNGDGTFNTMTASTPVAESKGLGLIVFRNPDAEFPSIFVANDQTQKFLLSLNYDESGEPGLTDSAFQTGLGYSGDGLLTAAMGIAADDVDNNGLIDFFVTNFKDESNTLYLQISEGLFQDLSRTAGLDAAGIPFVGWGTQFLDADLDGDLDLVVANGHVDDYRDEDGEFHMRPQVFRNTGDAQFQEVASEQAGDYFAQKFLGRGLAKLDWNQDGLTDFAVSNMGGPASLVTNATAHRGNFINVRLHATTTSRDAFYSQVEVRTEQSQWIRQLCAGSGYHACNERVLQFGLGSDEAIQSVRVLWPSGAETLIENPVTDCTLELVEGRTVGLLSKDHDVSRLTGSQSHPRPVDNLPQVDCNDLYCPRHTETCHIRCSTRTCPTQTVAAVSCVRRWPLSGCLAHIAEHKRIDR